MSFPEFCSGKSCLLIEIICLNQIELGTVIFSDKNCKVTLCFKYISSPYEPSAHVS